MKDKINKSNKSDKKVPNPKTRAVPESASKAAEKFPCTPTPMVQAAKAQDEAVGF